MRSVSEPMRGHQVAGALAAEVLERQAAAGARRWWCAGRRRCARTPAPGCRSAPSPGPRPASAGGQQPAQAASSAMWCRWRYAVLEGDQHLVHQRHGEVGRHQRGGGGRQGERRSRPASWPLVGAGKAPQAQQGPGGRLGRISRAQAGHSSVSGGSGACAGGAGGPLLVASARGRRPARICCSKRSARRERLGLAPA